MGEPPSGLQHLRAAGRSYLGGMKRWVWFSFDASDTTFKKLTQDEPPVTGAAAIREMSGRWSADKRYDNLDQQSVRWQEVPAISRPEVYYLGKSVSNSSIIWTGVLIIDRRRHRGYIHLGGD